MRRTVWLGQLVCLGGGLGKEIPVGGRNCFGECGNGASGSYIVDSECSWCIRR